MGINRLVKELKETQKSPLEGINVVINEEDVTDIQADVEGPAGTPYEGGTFRMKLALGADFPSAPPKGFFLTTIFHPNVAKNGEICVNVLKRDWKPDLGIRHVFMIARCLLIEPNAESALNEEAGKMLLDDYESYSERATLMTQIHACKKNGSAKADADDSKTSPKRKSKMEKDVSEKKKVEKKRSLKRL